MHLIWTSARVPPIPSGRTIPTVQTKTSARMLLLALLIILGSAQLGAALNADKNCGGLEDFPCGP